MIKILNIIKRLLYIILGSFFGIYIGLYMEIFFDPTFQYSNWGMFFSHGDHSVFFALLGILEGGLLGFWLPSNNPKTYRIRVIVFFLLIFLFLIATYIYL